MKPNGVDWGVRPFASSGRAVYFCKQEAAARSCLSCCKSKTHNAVQGWLRSLSTRHVLMWLTVPKSTVILAPRCSCVVVTSRDLIVKRHKSLAMGIATRRSRLVTCAKTGPNSNGASPLLHFMLQEDVVAPNRRTICIISSLLRGNSAGCMLESALEGLSRCITRRIWFHGSSRFLVESLKSETQPQACTALPFQVRLLQSSTVETKWA